MFSEKKILLLGIWILIVPFLGIPAGGKTFLFVVTGLCLVLAALWRFRGAYAAEGDRREEFSADSFSERNTAGRVKDDSDRSGASS